MNAKTTRLLKEARAIFWPWCAVIFAGALPLVLGSHAGWTEGIAEMAFFGGILLLAILPFGHEFQHRTLSLLLSQPVDRMEIWREKLIVTSVAVLSAALAFTYGLRSVLQQNPKLWEFAGVYIITTIASAAFWTLFARSTIGGFALYGLALDLYLLFFVIVGRLLGYSTALNWDEILGPNASSARSIACLFFAGVMVWLGRRKLARFQATGGMAGDDLLAGQEVMPEVFARWFRCRPAGAVLNLIRKELRLLRPLWQITMLALLVWTGLTMFGLVPKAGSNNNLPSAVKPVIAMGVISTLMLAILAGSLSLGEERTSGTHAWHMTLPVSARLQWLVKLLIALCAGVVCAVLLPGLALIVGGFLFGSPLMFVDLNIGIGWMLYVLLLTFASFWSACAVNGTVRAAMWVFPMLGAIVFAGEFGAWVASGLMDLALLRFDSSLFADFRFTNAVANIHMFDFGRHIMLMVGLFIVSILILAVIQSYRMFRAQAQDSISSVIRNLLPLATVVFLCLFSFLAFYTFVDHAKRQMWTMFRETQEAIMKTHPGTMNLDAAHPLQLAGEDMAKAAPLSDRTRRWLRNSRISLAPNNHFTGPYCCSGNSRSITYPPDNNDLWFLATIHLASGSDCTLSFGGQKGYGVLGGVCK